MKEYHSGMQFTGVTEDDHGYAPAQASRHRRARGVERGHDDRPGRRRAAAEPATRPARGAAHAGTPLARWTAWRDLIAAARTIDEQSGGEKAPDPAGQSRHPARRPRRGGGHGGDGQRPAQTEGER